ncbi:MAG: zf-HC2 domain-containing protein [Gemmatimonadota bacterium]|jgi:anti-sigma factor (TIGR02949 family)|nr:MAG: zf-HC2 domain-containing protein [Gemmatimonadota bacterium]
MTDNGSSRGGKPDRDRDAESRELSCEEAAKRVFEFLDGELPPVDAEKVRHHVEVCRRCYPYFNFERFFLDYVRERGLKPRRSRDLEERLRRLLEEAEEP